MHAKSICASTTNPSVGLVSWPTNSISGERLGVLLVDDDLLIRHMLESYLARNYTVFTAANGEEALRIIERHGSAIKVVLSDIQMPTCDGLTLMSMIRKLQPELCVIMISGTSDVSQAIRAMREGAYDYVTKPIRELEQITLIIQRWLHQQSLETKLAQYADLHKQMMRNMKVLSFLALDVSRSFGLKAHEDPFIAQYTFYSYHLFIERIVIEHGGVIHSTAGDGMMAGFEKADDAVTAAETILVQLHSFNQRENQLSEDFKVRLGIHTGSVIVEDSLRINTLFAKTLDVAGHIQKDACAGQIEISEDTLKSLTVRTRFLPAGRQIDGLEIHYLPVTVSQQ